MLFSRRFRVWKILGALLLLYAGCRLNHARAGLSEVPLWACEGRPERHDGRRFWILAEKVTASDAAAGVVEVEPKGYRLRIRSAQDVLPRWPAPGDRLYATVRFRRGEGFEMEPGGHVSPAQAVTHLTLYLVSLPALAFVLVVFLRHFRPTLRGGLEARGQEEPRA